MVLAGASRQRTNAVSNNSTKTKALKKRPQPRWLQRPMAALENETPPAPESRPRLLDKADVTAITNVTFPTIWAWMRAGTFPRSRVVGGKSMWLSSEVEGWLAGLPLRPLKGDQPTRAA
jgi:predicted DNA-binding transcriptional regulator AlpA